MSQLKKETLSSTSLTESLDETSLGVVAWVISLPEFALLVKLLTAGAELHRDEEQSSHTRDALNTLNMELQQSEEA